MTTENIRNFCIIAHIDHGKSKLADRLLQLTDTMPDREMTDQVLDSMDLEREKGVTNRCGVFIEQEYPTADRVVLHFDLSLAEMIVDIFDLLKSWTRGYASLDYQFLGYRTGDLVKLEILINNQTVDALSLIVHCASAFRKGKALVSKLQKLIPRQQFAVPIQAAVGGRVISCANVSALRKDVLAKCYGGDVTRKRKLLEKKRRGKKRLKRVGNIDIPQDSFMAVLRLGEE